MCLPIPRLPPIPPFRFDGVREGVITFYELNDVKSVPMKIELPNDRDFQAQAVAAGFATVEDYVVTLLDRDAERVAIQQGIDDMNAGRLRPFSEFDAELRREFGFGPPQ